MIEAKKFVAYPEDNTKYLKVIKFSFQELARETKILTFKIKKIQIWI